MLVYFNTIMIEIFNGLTGHYSVKLPRKPGKRIVGLCQISDHYHFKSMPGAPAWSGLEILADFVGKPLIHSSSCRFPRQPQHGIFRYLCGYFTKFSVTSLITEYFAILTGIFTISLQSALTWNISLSLRDFY